MDTQLELPVLNSIMYTYIKCCYTYFAVSTLKYEIPYIIVRLSILQVYFFRHKLGNCRQEVNERDTPLKFDENEAFLYLLD